MKYTLYLTHGLPGSGKSTLAKAIQEKYANEGIICPIFEADDYFVDDDGQYRFSQKDCPNAHQQCWNRVVKAMNNNFIGIVVSNTNLTWKEIKAYVHMAHLNKYSTVLVEPQTEWANNIEELVVKNIHNVPRETFDRMVQKKQEPGYLREKIKQVYSHTFEW